MSKIVKSGFDLQKADVWFQISQVSVIPVVKSCKVFPQEIASVGLKEEDIVDWIKIKTHGRITSLGDYRNEMKFKFAPKLLVDGHFVDKFEWGMLQKHWKYFKQSQLTSTIHIKSETGLVNPQVFQIFVEGMHARDLSTVDVQALVDKNVKWEEIDAVGRLIEQLEPTNPTWVCGPKIQDLCSKMTHIFTGIGAMEDIADNTYSSVLHETLESMIKTANDVPVSGSLKKFAVNYSDHNPNIKPSNDDLLEMFKRVWLVEVVSWDEITIAESDEDECPRKDSLVDIIGDLPLTMADQVVDSVIQRSKDVIEYIDGCNQVRMNQDLSDVYDAVWETFGSKISDGSGVMFIKILYYMCLEWEYSDARFMDIHKLINHSSFELDEWADILTFMVKKDIGVFRDKDYKQKLIECVLNVASQLSDKLQCKSELKYEDWEYITSVLEWFYKDSDRDEKVIVDFVKLTCNKLMTVTTKSDFNMQVFGFYMFHYKQKIPVQVADIFEHEFNGIVNWSYHTIG